MQIVTEGPRRGLIRRARRALAVALGVLLLVVGVVAAALSVVLVLVIVLLPTESGPDPQVVAVAAGAAGLAAVGGVLGLRLIRGRRRLVLFLRRFGLEEATEAVTYAVDAAVGRSWRIATLDDASVSPVGVPSGTRRSLGLAALLGGAVLVAGAAWFVTSGGVEGLIDAPLRDIMDQMFEQSAPGEDAGPGEILEGLFAGIIGALVVGVAVGAVLVMIVVVVLLVVAVFGVTGLFSAGGYLRARGVERAKTAEVSTPAELDEVTGQLARRSRRILGARLTVVTADHDLWRDAVRRLADVASAVLIDVSEPSENLLWEIRTLREDTAARRVLIGDHDRLVELTSVDTPPGDDPDVVARLLELLEGEEVLAHGPDRRARRRFARMLHARLEAVG